MIMTDPHHISPQPDKFASELPPDVREAVHENAARKVVARREMLEQLYGDNLKEMRQQAGRIRRHVISRLADYLEEFASNAKNAGWKIHWAVDSSEARRITLQILKDANAKRIVKGKSMVSEEIGLNFALEENGFHVRETDLGEYILQLDGDTPSHIVTPVIHKSIADVSETFSREELGPRSMDPETLTMQARTRLREDFNQADAGISGVNFAVAGSGRICIVENEGNNRLSTSAPRLHIALMGIEKIIPADADLALFLKLLAVSSTGQQINVYTHFLRGPKKESEPDGPNEAHIILIDNGRSKIARGEFADILNCIRCGACLNVCPVYRQATGHGYGSVYPGPVGAVLSPILQLEDMMPHYRELPAASSLCAACNEVCPVDIPIPELLLRLRRDLKKRGLAKKESPAFDGWRFISTKPRLWRMGLSLLRLFGSKSAVAFGPPPLRRWKENHSLPDPPKESFRNWWKEKEKKK